MHIVGQFGIPNTLQCSAGDHLVFCFGEVDVRVHLWEIAKQRSISIHVAITDVVTRYVERIRSFCVQRNAMGYVIAAPPQAVPTTPDAIVPVVDTIQDRVARTNAVNAMLAQICATDIKLIDPWGPFCNEDGSLNMNHSDGIVHVASHFNETIRDLVVPHFSSDA